MKKWLQGTTFIKEVWYRFKKNRMAMAGAMIVILMILIAAFAPWITPTIRMSQSAESVPTSVQNTCWARIYTGGICSVA